MDVILLPGQLTYKILGGILDFYFLMGPTPNEVISQISQVIGKPAMMPYWAYGFHHCRFGYKTIEQVESMRDRYEQANIPLDNVWTDIE